MMDKFWEWMREEHHFTGIYCSDGCGITPIEFAHRDGSEIPKQVLIGFMIEYIENHWNEIYGRSYELECGAVEDMYDRLKSLIEDIK